MSKLIVRAYTFLLVALAVISIITAWALDSLLILAIEVCVDVILITGCIFYILKKKLFLWRYFLLLAVAGEIILLSLEKENIRLLILWAIILAPALYINLKVDRYISKKLTAIHLK